MEQAEASAAVVDVEELRDLLITAVTGGESRDRRYTLLRQLALSSPTMAPLISQRVRNSLRLKDYVQDLCREARTYPERRRLIRAEFEQLVGSTQSSKTDPPKSATSRSILVVHGHDHHARDQVALMLTKNGYEPVVLQEQPNEGQTLIEKLEGADAAYAVAIFSSDDLGSLKGEASKPRARQNVVLEYGYLVGRLGRDRVVALYDTDIELPSDLLGLGMIDIGKEDWRARLAKEMARAGLTIGIETI